MFVPWTTLAGFVFVSGALLSNAARVRPSVVVTSAAQPVDAENPAPAWGPPPSPVGGLVPDSPAEALG